MLFCTEQSGMDNLQREGVSSDRTFLVGNLMIDTLIKNREKAEGARILSELELTARGYAVLTLHRPSNVDDPEVFKRLVDAIEVMQRDLPIVFPVHPRTRAKLAETALGQRVAAMKNVRMIDPLGYLDFLKLTASARVVLTDSGGIQEETTALAVPCLTMRENTERPITVDQGTNTLVGRSRQRAQECVDDVIRTGGKQGRTPERWDGHAAERIAEELGAWLGLASVAREMVST
jgi:UDP-N-acetylglucosamine 2-epimerase (non-hydrolysing)